MRNQSIASIGRREMGLLIITHHDKLLEHNTPDFTHVILGGRIVQTGTGDLAARLHKEGYDAVRSQHPDAARDEEAMTAGSKM